MSSSLIRFKSYNTYVNNSSGFRKDEENFSLNFPVALLFQLDVLLNYSFPNYGFFTWVHTSGNFQLSASKKFGVDFSIISEPLDVKVRAYSSTSAGVGPKSGFKKYVWLPKISESTYATACGSISGVLFSA